MKPKEDRPWYYADCPHYRIPKAMWWCPPYNTLSPEAKILYAALLDRTRLSARNQKTFLTFDCKIYVYYTLTAIQDLVGCGHDKATALLQELRDLGLIETRREGIGRPYQIIVKPIEWRSVRLSAGGTEVYPKW